jgi:hypothetical protein
MDANPSIEKATFPRDESAERPAPEMKRGDPALEEALFTEPLIRSEVLASGSRLEPIFASHRKRLLEHSYSQEEMPVAQSTGIPSVLWLSALAPGQIAGLVARLPAVGASAEACAVSQGEGAAE